MYTQTHFLYDGKHLARSDNTGGLNGTLPRWPSENINERTEYPFTDVPKIVGLLAMERVPTNYEHLDGDQGSMSSASRITNHCLGPF
jgi:hypothetical protein